MKLRSILFVAFVFVSVIPVGIIGYWQQEHVLEHELSSVKDKHLLIARNIIHALERYAHDVRMAFRLTERTINAEESAADLELLLVGLNFRYAVFADERGNIDRQLCVLTCPDTVMFRDVVFPSLTLEFDKALKNDNATFFSGIKPNDNGDPALYLISATENGLLAIAELTTSYIKEIQQSISFDERGHAAIVDATGTVMAHPKPEWVTEMKNISKLPVIQAMMRGETGVTRFYSPALKAEMVAGYTAVPTTRWGVMVPQPIEELAAEARTFQVALIGVALFGIVTALALSWWLSGVLSKPVNQIAAAALGFDAAKSSDISAFDGKLVPAEIKELRTSFNHMVSAIALKNSELVAALLEAQRANKAKSEFLSSISHELRTPMNAILGFSQVLERSKRTTFSERDRASLEMINTSAGHMMSLINQVLELSRIEAGKMDMNLSEVDLNELTAEVVAGHQHAAAQANVLIRNHLNPNTLPIIQTDRQRITQALSNLLTNAIKYNRGEGRVDVTGILAMNNFVRISVTDTGVGIPAEKTGKVFDMFERLGYEQSDIDGTGIGLSIARKLIVDLGGEIDFESTPGKGSTFWIDIPTTPPVTI